MTRRALVPALLAAVTLLPSAHAAAPAPQVVDLKGDTVVPSFDILSGRVSSVRSGRSTLLQGEVRLAAAPQAGLPVEYDLGLIVGCDLYQFVYTWAAGVGTVSESSFGRWDYCYRDIGSEPEETSPVDVAVHGTTLTWRVPYRYGIHRGTVVTRIFAGSCYEICVDNFVPVTDSAVGGRSYVVGSDLPRR